MNDLQKMSNRLLALCEAHGERKIYQAGQQIHQRGDKEPGLKVIQSGIVKVGNYGLDGKYQLASYLSRGDSFGEVTVIVNEPRTHHSQALDDVIISHLCRKKFDYLHQHEPEFNTYLLTSLAAKLNTALELMDDHRRLPTHVRLAKLLYKRCHQNGINSIKLRQQDCAELLAVTVLSLHKALHKLTEIGLVSTSYGAIIVLDKITLEYWLNEHLSLLPVHYSS
jgi:CRP/FNR family transcriptional regulator, cyclic AMP receptor protein